MGPDKSLKLDSGVVLFGQPSRKISQGNDVDHRDLDACTLARRQHWRVRLGALSRRALFGIVEHQINRDTDAVACVVKNLGG